MHPTAWSPDAVLVISWWSLILSRSHVGRRGHPGLLAPSVDPEMGASGLRVGFSFAV